MVSEEVSQSIDMGLKALREGIFQPQVKFSEFIFMISFAAGCLCRVLEVFLIHARFIWRNLVYGTFFGIVSKPPPPPTSVTKRRCPTLLPLSYSIFSLCNTNRDTEWTASRMYRTPKRAPTVRTASRILYWSNPTQNKVSLIATQGAHSYSSDKCDFAH